MKQIYALQNNNGDWRVLTHALGVKNSTANQRIKKHEEPEKQRGGRRNFKIHNEYHLFMEQSIERNSEITLQQTKQLLKNEHKTEHLD